MKPKVFIGSSLEGKDVANAIDAGLQHIAEPTVWLAGIFGLSDVTASRLMHEVRDSDFGIFVFTPDDAANIRGRLLSVPRDNVVYELGLFSGALGTERCFFVTPLNVDIHLPTDLLGMTAGHYDPNRRDQNLRAAVNPVCTSAGIKFRELGFRHGTTSDWLLEWATAYEWCGQIREDAHRLSERDKIFDSMKGFVRQHPVNKLTLLKKHRLGFYMHLAASIVVQPEAGDHELLIDMKGRDLPRGQTQHKVLDAMYALKVNDKLSVEGQIQLVKWFSRLPDQEEWTLKRFNDLIA